MLCIWLNFLLRKTFGQECATTGEMRTTGLNCGLDLHYLSTVMALQKGDPGARKVRGPLFGVPSYLKKAFANCHRGSHF